MSISYIGIWYAVSEAAAIAFLLVATWLRKIRFRWFGDKPVDEMVLFSDIIVAGLGIALFIVGLTLFERSYGPIAFVVLLQPFIACGVSVSILWVNTERLVFFLYERYVLRIGDD